jgi:hypothetical protein
LWQLLGLFAASPRSASLHCGLFAAIPLQILQQAGQPFINRFFIELFYSAMCGFSCQTTAPANQKTAAICNWWARAKALEAK